MKGFAVVAAMLGSVVLAAAPAAKASELPGTGQPGPQPDADVAVDQGALWTLDYGPAYDLSRPEADDPLAGLPVAPGGVVSRWGAVSR
jgi:hypothetical protein